MLDSSESKAVNRHWSLEQDSDEEVKPDDVEDLARCPPLLKERSSSQNVSVLKVGDRTQLNLFDIKPPPDDTNVRVVPLSPTRCDPAACSVVSPDTDDNDEYDDDIEEGSDEEGQGNDNKERLLLSTVLQGDGQVPLDKQRKRLRKNPPAPCHGLNVSTKQSSVRGCFQWARSP